MYNYDGDLLFTCSDDGKVCLYDTFSCNRLGVFDIKESCKSIDVSKDSKYLLAAATTVGYCIYNVNDGKEVARGKVPGFQTK